VNTTALQFNFTQ